MRLQNKFTRVFIFPLFCGVVISIILTVAILFQFKNYYADKALITNLAALEKGKRNALILTVQDLLHKKFQKAIYALTMLKKYYLFYAKQLENTQVDLQLIGKFMTNGVEFWENADRRWEEVTNDAERFYDYVIWHTSNQVKQVEQLPSLAREQLMVLTQMIPYMRTLWEVSENKESYRYDSIYFCNRRSELFATYPIQDKYMFEMYVNQRNPAWCKDNYGKFPVYYYFPCRDWYLQILSVLESHPEQTVFITYPYQFAGYDIYDIKYGLSVCLKFDDPIAKKYATTDPLLLMAVICIDLFFSDIINTFELFNKELNGYFFVLRVYSDVPIYYPMILKSNYFSNLARYEFDIRYDFFPEELDYFMTNIVELFTQNYDDYSIQQEQKGYSFGMNQDVFSINTSLLSFNNYTKKGIVNNFVVYPIKLFTNDSNLNEPHHILTAIYISREDLFAEDIDSYQISLYPNLIIQTVFFAFIEVILILLVRYIIILIASYIVNPIKTLQKLLCMNLGSYTTLEEKKDENLVKIELKDHKTVEHKKVKSSDKIEIPSEMQFENSNDKNIYLKEEKDADGSDETETENDLLLNIRNEEMDNLFEILLDLKNVLLFTSNSRTNFNKSALVQFANSKQLFFKVQNEKGMKVCDSNIGNLSLLCQKYDKAIMHLSSAMIEDYATSTDILKTEKIDNLIGDAKFETLKEIIHLKIEEKKSRHSRLLQRQSNRNEISGVLQEGQEEPKAGIIETQSGCPQRDACEFINLESRYPKMIYAYKNFFKFLLKLLKSLDNQKEIDNNSNSELFKADLFIFQKNHSLSAFENLIQNYIFRSVDAGDFRRIGEAILEYIEFLIIFKLKRIHSPRNQSLNDTQSHSEMEVDTFRLKVLSQISDLFKIFERIYDIVRGKDNSESYYKIFLDELHMNVEDRSETIEAHYLILYQKEKYLKGKVSKFCGHYAEALNYFSESCKHTLPVSNALIVQKSIKQVIKIMKNLEDSIAKDIQVRSCPNNLLVSPKRSITSVTPLPYGALHSKLTAISQYITKLTQQLQSLHSLPKDLAVIIDVSPVTSCKNIRKILTATIHFFESYISSSDRFSLFLYSSESINMILPLLEKNFDTYSYVKGVINDLPGSNELIAWQKENNHNSNAHFEIKITKQYIYACNAIREVSEYLFKKSSEGETRHKWIVAFTQSFNKEHNDEHNDEYDNQITFNELENVVENSQVLNLVIIGQGMDTSLVLILNEKLCEVFSQKSRYLEYEHIGKMKSILKVVGQVKQEEFPNEKYKSDKTTRV